MVVWLIRVPGLNLTVVEPEYFIQSANTLIVPGGHNIGVKGTNDLTGEVLDYSAGRKFALEKFPGDQLRLCVAIIVQ